MTIMMLMRVPMQIVLVSVMVMMMVAIIVVIHVIMMMAMFARSMIIGKAALTIMTVVVFVVV